MIRTRPGGLPELAGNQKPASDPASHVWLSASAGTGKTQVLTARVYRLLLRGVDPSAILCLTFTKAGASEMAERIGRRLAAWVRMPAGELRQDLFNLGEQHLDEDVIERARTLFARVLDAAGGGIRIQTIHGFCQGLLAAFPVEAGLAPGFRPLEGREEAVLQREALAGMLVDAERDGRGWIVAAIGALSLRMGEEAAERFLQACARAPEGLAALPPGDLGAWMRGALDLPAGDIDEHIASHCADDAFDCASLARIVAANRGWGATTGLGHAGIGERWLAGTAAERVAALADLGGIAFTAKGDPRKYSAKLSDHDADYPELALALGSRCAELVRLRDRVGYADLLARALDAGRDYAAAYTRAKRRIGAVDFDDLIRATVRLLAQPGMGDWVRYKLDQATDHILIDEAQDTNDQQWAIVGALAAEFFAGEGAHGRETRTLFTVGDYKQAIFGFQGTSPIFFAAAQRRFVELADEAYDREARRGTPMAELSLTSSFRSTAPILEFVDAALADLPAPGLGIDGPLEPHASVVPGPGVVTLLPPVPADTDDEGEEGWVSDAVRTLATRIARQVRGWLDEGTMLASKGRPLRAEDVMILVRRRGMLAALLVARLHAEGVAVAGVDRLRLNAPLAVQDLLAAVRFALQPDDDLSLASLLVSPLIGWSQDELMHAAPRAHGSLWAHLRATRDGDRLAPLLAILGRADFATPYRFLEEILSGPLDGRRKLIRRLGEEARDPIDELLAAALDFEARATPSLQLFLDWFDRGDVEIKRDPSQPAGAVRVMTAHGAKGLQAPVVILADATADPERAQRGSVGWSPDGVAPPVPVFRPRTAERHGPIGDLFDAADRAEMEEHWRLFYVATTRAEERLVLAGALARGKTEVPAQSWYAAAVRAFAVLDVPPGEGERSFAGTVPARPVRIDRTAATGVTALVAVPAWARRPALAEARPPRPLAPSSLGGDEVSDPPPGPALRAAAERGRLLHALFERLPAIAAETRAEAGARWLARQGAADPAAVLADALAVIADPRLAALFGPEALAEAPVSAVIGGLVVSGTIDRLLVEADRVRLVDFKTGRRAPATLAEVPVYHLRQMAAYAAALGVIFPGRRVEAALLYTAGPTLFALPDALLDEHKPRLAATEQS